VKDPTATYRSNCAITIPVSAFLKTTVFPNPATSVINIDNVVLDSATLYDSTGQRVETTNSLGKGLNNIINTSNLSRGLYTIKLESNGETVSRKIVLE
jgi:hypothetical protein